MQYHRNYRPHRNRKPAYRPTLRFFAIVSVSLFLVMSTVAQKRVGPGTKKIAQKQTRLTAKQIAAKSLKSVVLVVCDNGIDEEEGNAVQGSGFFIGSGIIVTNYHVIKGMTRGVIQLAVGKERKIFRIARVLGYDAEADLAVLSVPSARRSAMSTLRLANDALPEIGETIYALGNPEGLVGTISPGIISAAVRSKEKKARLQITAPISEGSSGGPLINEDGEVIGIVVSSLSEGQNLNFAVPVSLLRSTISGLEYPTPSMNVSDELNEVIEGNPRGWIWGSGIPKEATTEKAKTDCPKVETKLVYDDDKSLEGLKGIQVVVETMGPEIAPLIGEDLITAQTEATLRKYGIKVVGDENFNEPGEPFLYLNLNCIEIAGGFACSVRLELRQLARSEVTKSHVFYAVTTWQESSILRASRSNLRSSILGSIDAKVITFVNDFLKVNR